MADRSGIDSLGPLRLAYSAFLLFGLCLIANYQVASDGTWYLYGKALHNGVRLYADLRLPQQPLFILLTAGWQPLLGHSWLLSLVPTIINLLIFATGFYLLARRSDWPAWQRAIVFLCASTLAIGWSSYRFDDYRVLTDIIAIYVALIFLRLLDDPATPFSPPATLLIGLLCGLSFMTRANDGLLLLVAATAIVVYGASGKRLLILSMLFMGFLIAAAAVLLLTGDSVRAYFDYTLLHSAASKGGSQQMGLSPVFLVANLLTYLVQATVLFVIVAILIGAAIPVVLAERLNRLASPPSPAIRGGAILFAIVVEGTMLLFLHGVAYDLITNLASAIGIAALFGTALWIGLAFIGQLSLRDRRMVVMLIPFGALISAGMSSAGHITGIHEPVGLFIALLPIPFGRERVNRATRAYATCLALLLSISIVVGKIGMPLDWQFYRAQPMFVDRAIIRHPLYGPMIIDRRMNSFFEGVCRRIRAEQAPVELLSMPYSYANYYCGIDPWHLNVQTYFDTSSAETVNRIVRDLTVRPPSWILYQRQIKVLRSNEIFFNHGQPSPHRRLDDLIESRVREGRWTVVERWTEQPGDEWQLIRTVGRSSVTPTSIGDRPAAPAR